MINKEVDDVQQELHSLKMRLEMKTNMEKYYIEENERLVQIIEELRQQLIEVKNQPPELNINEMTTSFADNTTNPILSEIEDLHLKIINLESENRSLQERIDIMEINKDTTALNLTNNGALSEITEENENLRKKLEITQSQILRFNRQVEEQEMDIESARALVSELQTNLKIAREELADVNVELESMKLQAGAVGDTRGNSLFSEIEDRRVRAEQLVAKQNFALEDLTKKLNTVQTESRRKILQARAEANMSLNKRDTTIIDELLAERQRLNLEVYKLNVTVSNYKDREVDKLHEADQLTEAFRPEKNTQNKLVKALEKRLDHYKFKATKLENDMEHQRMHLLNVAQVRYELSQELAHQHSVTGRLMDELNFCREQLRSETGTKENSDPLFPNRDVALPLSFYSEKGLEEQKSSEVEIAKAAVVSSSQNRKSEEIQEQVNCKPS